MIKMPRRNVTRFFIPLIDVLILLFCIFLLMEFNSESEVGAQSEIVAEQSDEMQQLEADLRRRTKELQKYDELRPQLKDLEQLRNELDRLKNAQAQTLQQRTLFRIIDIEGKDGSLSFYDEANPDQPILRIPDEKSAALLIERHVREAMGRELYYYFMLPRPLRGYPTLGQVRQYRDWFAKTANSLAEKR